MTNVEILPTENQSLTKQSFQFPAILENEGDLACKRALEYFTVKIRTRIPTKPKDVQFGNFSRGVRIEAVGLRISSLLRLQPTLNNIKRTCQQINSISL